jgi:hypothetical protein
MEPVIDSMGFTQPFRRKDSEFLQGATITMRESLDGRIAVAAISVATAAVVVSVAAIAVIPLFTGYERNNNLRILVTAGRRV